MGSLIPELPTATTIPDNALFLLSYSGAPSQIVSFANLTKNCTFLRSAGSNDLTLGVGNSSIPGFRMTNADKYIGVANSSSFVPLSIFHISGSSGTNPMLTIENPNNSTGGIRFYDQTGSWYIRKDFLNNFTISGTKTNEIYKNNLSINPFGDVLITDASQYVNTNIDTGINVQLSAGTGIRLSLNNNTNRNDFTWTHSGLNSDRDLYIGYFTGTNATSGTFFGKSGALFIDKDDGAARLGNIDKITDSRLMIVNNGVSDGIYKTLTVEDATIPNIFFRQNAVPSSTASIMYDRSTSQMHFARNKGSASVSSSDAIIFDLNSKRLGVGGIDPSYVIDATGSDTVISRFQTSSNAIFSRIQSNFASSSGPVDYAATAYGSGNFNSFLIGYDFDKAEVGPTGPSSSSRVGQFFFQTGNTSNQYFPSRNVVTISDQGDINAKGAYTSQSGYCFGKFLHIHRTSNITGGAVYLNLENIDYGFQSSGNTAYHSLMPASGRIISVDFTCQLNSGLNNATGFLVFNPFTGITLTNANTRTYVSGISSTAAKKFIQIWNPVTNTYVTNASNVSAFLDSHAYVSGLITGQGILNLRARAGGSVSGNRFFNSINSLNFNLNDYASWVAYGVGSTGQFIQLTGAMNLTTMVEYFYASDTDSVNTPYVY